MWAAAAVLLAGGLWSLQGVTIRWIATMPSEEIVFWRNLGQFSVLIAWVVARSRGGLLGAFRSAGRPALLGGLFQSISSLCIVFAFAYTTVANVAFIMSSAPFVVAIIAWLVLGERLSARATAAMAAGVFGVGVMMLEGLESGRLFGNALAFVTTLGFAALTIVLRWGRQADMVPTVCWGALIGITTGLVLTEARLEAPPADVALCLVMGGGQIATGQILYIVASRHVTAALLAFLSLSEIVLSPLWAWLGASEVPSALTLAGGSIVLAALMSQTAVGAARTAQRQRRSTRS